MIGIQRAGTLAMDTLTPARRSEIMGLVKSKDTSPELAVRRIVHRLGYRFRLHRRDLPGHPDIVLPRLRSVIFIHGCFWHRHTGCPNTRMPKSRESFWSDKFRRNVERDRMARRRLRRDGWRVLIVWECEVGRRGLEAKLKRFLEVSREVA